LLSAMAGPALAGVVMFAAVATARAQLLLEGPYALLLYITVGVVSYSAVSLAINRGVLRDVRSVFVVGPKPSKDK